MANQVFVLFLMYTIEIYWEIKWYFYDMKQIIAVIKIYFRCWLFHLPRPLNALRFPFNHYARFSCKIPCFGCFC